VNFEDALATAETGVDQVLARAQYTYQTQGSDAYTYPSTASACGATTSINWTTSTAPDGSPAPGSFATDAQSIAAERAWAKSWLQQLGASSACRMHTSTGDYAFFKPVGHNAVYGMGWSPRYGASRAKTRYLKSEYLFRPYAPSDAILTQGNVELDSSTTVRSAPPNPDTLASVHSNGNVTVNNGNPTVYGPVSQSGSGSLVSSNRFYSNTNGNVTKTVTESLPTVDAAAVWGGSHATPVVGGWYDLCPDGSVHSPDGAAPCAGTTLASAATVAASGYRGWTFAQVSGIPTWYAGTGLATGGYSGTYYISGGDVVNNASNAGGPVPNLTVIASAQSTYPNPPTCNKTGGNITWDHTDIASYSLSHTFLIADQDLLTTSNFYAGSDTNGTIISGFFIAGDQMQLETSANGAYGAVIAGDQCNPSNSLVSSDVVKNPSIYYDPNSVTPFVNVINKTLWLEYSG
jgi:hypothetical protein